MFLNNKYYVMNWKIKVIYTIQKPTSVLLIYISLFENNKILQVDL